MRRPNCPGTHQPFQPHTAIQCACNPPQRHRQLADTTSTQPLKFVNAHPNIRLSIPKSRWYSTPGRFQRNVSHLSTSTHALLKVSTLTSPPLTAISSSGHTGSRLYLVVNTSPPSNSSQLPRPCHLAHSARRAPGRNSISAFNSAGHGRDSTVCFQRDHVGQRAQRRIAVDWP